MAVEADTLDPEEEAEAQESKKGKSRLLIILIVLVVLVSAGAGAYMTIGQPDAEQVIAEEMESDDKDVSEDREEEKEEAIYFSLDPAFVANISGKNRTRLLQVKIEAMTRNAKVKEDVTKHLPQIRNNVLLLLSSKTYTDLTDKAGKQQLRKEVRKEIQKILEAETGEEGIENVYFTSFVMH